jgi:hypothetical protein
LQLDVELKMTNIKYWHIWLHNKDLWVQGTGKTYGNLYEVSEKTVTNGIYLQEQYYIKLTKATFIDNRRSRCSDNTHVDWNHCFEHYVVTTLGCKMPWQTQWWDLPACNSKEQVHV